MTPLHAKLTQLASAFAKEIVRAAQESSLDELLGAKIGAPAAPTKRSAPAKPATRPTAGSLDGGRLLATLRASQGGIRSEDLRKKLGVTREALVAELQKALAAGQITKTGERRATTYRAS